MPLTDAPIAHLRTPEEAAQWLRQRVRGQLRTDSRQVQAGDGFIAWPGAAADGRRFMARPKKRRLRWPACPLARPWPACPA